MTDKYVSVVDAAKQVRTALKQAFPRSKFSVTSHAGIRVVWTDDGPEVQQVKDALVNAGCAEAVAHYGEIYLRAHGHHFWFDRYNVAERAAEEKTRELRHQEYERQRQREDEAVKAAARAKRSAEQAESGVSKPVALDPAQEQAAHQAFEALRVRAEADVTTDTERQHRPSWAPPLILDGELLETCRELAYLAPDDKPIARLWATFVDPKGSRRVLREEISSLPLLGINCRGFQLHPGGERQPRSSILFEAQRTSSDKWQFGPRLYIPDYRSPKAWEWGSLIRERLRAQEALDSESVERLSQKIAAIETEDRINAQAQQRQSRLRLRAIELAKLRVLDFAGAPDAQMQLAGRLCGHCCICFKALTDPISLERGIGPECLKYRVDYIKTLVARLRSNGQAIRIESIAARTGMPVSFITEVLNEMNIAA
jgi:hypothetical protein